MGIHLSTRNHKLICRLARVGDKTSSDKRTLRLFTQERNKKNVAVCDHTKTTNRAPSLDLDRAGAWSKTPPEMRVMSQQIAQTPPRSIGSFGRQTASRPIIDRLGQFIHIFLRFFCMPRVVQLRPGVLMICFFVSRHSPYTWGTTKGFLSDGCLRSEEAGRVSETDEGKI